jgi:hypothetical protein
MTNLSIPKAKIVICRSYGSGAAAKGSAKFLATRILRNPLKMLDSDERIQGNPSFSNPPLAGLSSRNGGLPRVSKGARPGA